MSLVKYKEKRNFKVSPEPEGGMSGNGRLRFVIQKHQARQLHYDFRLEMDDVLKSWAIPKGPSTDSDVRRLAMMVEDHPYDYRKFEGIIPEGYGAGTVMIWDEGYYAPEAGPGESKKMQNKLMTEALDKGKLHIVLFGKKLKGEYALIKVKGRGENAWLLFKVKDKYDSKEDITKQDKSVVSRHTMEEITKAG